MVGSADGLVVRRRISSSAKAARRFEGLRVGDCFEELGICDRFVGLRDERLGGGMGGVLDGNDMLAAGCCNVK